MSNMRSLVSALSERPETIIDLLDSELFKIPIDAQTTIQINGAQRRFGELRERVPMLARLAQEQEINEICGLGDLTPLLIPHSAMKSYPLSYIEKNQFDRLTRWLDGFTVYDLSMLDMSKCDSIDDWLDLLDQHTDVRVLHSTGTTGKLSFLPRGVPEMHRMAKVWAAKFDPYPGEPKPLNVDVKEAPVLYCSYRRGGMGHHRLLDYLTIDFYQGDENMVLAANPGRLSADVASISGRLRVASAKGELGKIQISPKLLERRDKFIADQKNAEQIMDHFLADVVTRYAGRTAVIIGAVPSVYQLAVEGLKRGYEKLFSPDTYIQRIGGMKGQTLPDDWEKTILRFFGAKRMHEGYGMTELVGSSRMCPEGHYHRPTWEIPFLLDPVMGSPSPRTGTHKGRYGFYDLNAETYWGGFLSGDEVTLSWGDTEPCPCGRVGPYIHYDIRRYSESEGGDDKITCAGAPEAHDKAIDFILQSIG